MTLAGMLRLAVALLVGVSAALGSTALSAQSPVMPDPRQMSGVPLPVSDLPAGTVTVRVVRGALSNPITNQPVELTGGANRTTNDAGRAEFTGLAPGARVKAVTVVDGERLESQEFAVPPSGGIRVMLVATDPEQARRDAEDRKLAAGPARSGIVVLGNQSRFVVEIGDDGLNVFNIIEIQNTARTPVSPPVPVVFDIPATAGSASILEGSSPLATAAGKRVTVSGPFPPGSTLVQFAYTLAYSGSTARVSQRLPAAMSQLNVIAQKVDATRVTSPQLAQQRERDAEGQTYIVAQGPPLAAGDTVTIDFAGLPHAPVWPRTVALVLAGLILAGGAVAAFQGRSARGVDVERRRLEGERERLLTELADIEASHRAGAVDAVQYADRRRQLIVALERVYAALDDEVAA